LSLYIDPSALLPAFVEEARSDTVDRLLRTSNEALCVSEFAAAEFASALSRLVRTHVLDQDLALQRLADFDAWRAAEAVLIDVESADIRSASIIVRRFDLMLRTPDALHVAIARRLGAALVTFDHRLATAARAMGVAVQIL